jgi:ABC-type nitrate/sulfonate/bicarbonate transport system substrate-binding protein
MCAAVIASSACREATPATTEGRVIRVGYSGEADFSDLPSLMAHVRLRERGYRVEPTFFSASDVAVQAVSGGSADIIHGSMISAWTAVSRGARLVTVMDHVANPYRLVAAPGISECRDLTGRRLAVPAESAVSTHLVRAFLRDDCPDAKPEIMLLTESSSRAAAFLNGGVEAGALELSSLLWLQAQAPGRFSVLSDFSTRWPSIKTTGVHANADFARREPDAVREYLRALFDANRAVMADPELLVSAAQERMGRSEDWHQAATAYVEAQAWPQNGGLTRADVDATLAFFKTYSRLDQRLTRDAVADLRFLEALLAGAQR